jgi:uncharacterized GH25 family protein
VDFFKPLCTAPAPLIRAVLVATALALSCASSATAHDFWIQPSAYWVQPQAVTPMTLQVGHGPARQRSPIPQQRIVRFNAIGPNGAATDQRSRLKLGGALMDGDIALPTPGAYVVVLQTDDRAQTHLPALRFNDYLRVEGLTPALEQRMRLHRMDADQSENYSRCAKAILQVGTVDVGSQAQVTRPVGLPLEIVPERSPYAEPRSATLPVRVLYGGRPLPGALVKLTNLENDATPFEMHLTDRSGRASFTMPQTGAWLLNVIWTRPQPPSAETDFETTFSSLSFGFAPNRPLRTP